LVRGRILNIGSKNHPIIQKAKKIIDFIIRAVGILFLVYVGLILLGVIVIGIIALITGGWEKFWTTLMSV